MVTSYNPWTVNSVHEFWFLNCPECQFNTKEEEFFRAHAIENHPASLNNIKKTVKEEALDNSFEYKQNNFENNCDYAEAYENQTLTESFYVDSISPEVQIKEEFVEDFSLNLNIEDAEDDKKGGGMTEDTPVWIFPFAVSEDERGIAPQRNLRASQKIAENLASTLQDARSGCQYTAHGLGSLAPIEGWTGSRIDLIVQGPYPDLESD